MWFVRGRRATALGLLGVALIAAVGISSLTGTAGAKRTPPKARPAPESPKITLPPPPRVADTRTNLQAAFTNEMNAKHRYLAFAKQAALEGYPCVAQLFRACAQAEQVHADRHVRAIAWSGGEARAILDPVSVGTTEENLKTAILGEIYEAVQLYPSLLAQAREEHESMAVRSMTFALSAEREHVRLLTDALVSLEERAPAGTLYVCPYCGKTVVSLDFSKCPHCFTAARRFLKEV